MKINNIIKKLLVVSIPCFITIFTAFSVSATNSIVVYGTIKNESDVSKKELENSVTLSGISNKDGSTVTINLILFKYYSDYTIELDIPSEDVPFLSDEETYSGRYSHCCLYISDYNEQTIQAILEENFGRGDRPAGYLYKNDNDEYKYRITCSLKSSDKKILTIYTANKEIPTPKGKYYDGLYEKYRVYEINVGIDNVDVKLLKSYWPNKSALKSVSL